MSDISVIIPVYGNEAAVRRCLQSVIAGRGDDDYGIVVVDDASPDEGLAAGLEAYCADIPKTRFFSHEENRGFAAAVTTGVDSSAGDVVILNSDTVVPEAWVHRLRSCAYASPRIATVTPFTNAGTICTYPLFCSDADLPEGLDLAALDALFLEANCGKSVEIPTGVGFCMYINRECWDALDGFDVNTFGSGYGEETDFCMRAANAGWTHRLCADLFVYHDGGLSFGSQRQGLMDKADKLMADRHPSYGERVERFIQADPAACFRARVDDARKAVVGQLDILEAEATRRSALTVKRLSESQALAVDRLTEVASLQNQCTEYERLLRESREEFAAMEAEAERRATAYIDLEAVYSDLEASYSDLEAAYSDLEAAYSDLEAAYSELKAGFSNLEAVHSDLIADYRRLETQHTQLSAHLDQEVRQLKETSSALDALQSEYGELFQERDEAALARDQAQHLVNEYRQSIHRLEQATADLEQLAMQRQSQLDELEAMWGVRLQRKIERLKGS